MANDTVDTDSRFAVNGVYWQHIPKEALMPDKPTLYIDYEGGTIRGPQAIIGRLFATPKTKTWLGPPEATMAISDPERLRQIAERLRQLGYPLVENRQPAS